MSARTVLTTLALVTTTAVAPLAVALPSSSTAEPGSAAETATINVIGPRPAARRDQPEELLPRDASGRTAIRLADGTFAAAAALNRMSPATLRALLLSDHSAQLDETGRLFYRDSLVGRAGASSPVGPAPFQSSATFTLHSKPGSQRTIYLDFNGATVRGTAWNGSRYDQIPDGEVPGFSLDADYSTWTAAEHATIQEVWQRVSEDYAPFDVDVTTQQPSSPDQIDRSSASDQVFGTTALISSDEFARDQLCGDPSCTGIAFTDVFDLAGSSNHGYYQPAWAFTATYDDVQSISETVSHEVGHNFGLVHDGKGPGTPYYAGHGIWTPIMGSGFGPVTQWSNASYAGGTNLDDNNQPMPRQDDVALIAENGAPFRADDAGNDVRSAEAALPGGTRVIGRRSDVDVYRIGTCTGTLTVTAASAPVSPNLDIRLTVLGADGDELSSADPPSGPGDGQTASGMGASVTYQATGQLLFAAVDGVGNGTPDDDYDDYGSLGQYTLTATGCNTGPSATPTSTPTATASPTASATPTLTTSPTPTPTATPTVAVPDAPLIGDARSGPIGGARTATVRWSAPLDDGGSPITEYQVAVHRMNAYGQIIDTYPADTWPADSLIARYRFYGRGRYAFQVVALNAQGASPTSALSRTVKPR